MNSLPSGVQLVPVSLTDTGPFECGAHIIQFGETGQYTSFAIIASPSSLLIAYTNAAHLSVFSDARTRIQLVNPNHHTSVIQQAPYGVVAIFRLTIISSQ